ncbi:MAG: T9SS type A sorting domain-containing protein [Ferruginibacter sp.]
MAFIRNCFVIAVMTLCILFTKAQTVSYPPLSSQLLKSTAADVAMLLQKAIPGSQFTTTIYSIIPATGIIFIYDSTITDNMACKIESNGSNYIRFSAAEDNGLCFGVYQYLQGLGFRFYQPGSIWEMIPALSSAFKQTDSTYTTDFKYKGWFISGGHNRWIMDNTSGYNWDNYFGENGHNWALYQRRNGMTGSYRFAGHRGDIMSGDYFATLQNNPCYVACYDHSRVASGQSVPDVNNVAAMDLWSQTIEQKYTVYKNNILGNPVLYTNQYRNFSYNNRYIGIEVPDAAKWGNSVDNTGCPGLAYSKESDQQFKLANYTAQKINARYPNARFQLYAYSTHADIPSPGISINNNIDIQLIPAVYQTLTSTNGIRNRWYKRTGNISEYNYLNLSGWSGETPGFYLHDLKASVQIAKDKKSQGVIWEASPAKFASLPYLLAANRNLLDNVAIDKSLQEFCDNMFSGAGKNMYELLQLWTDENSIAGGPSNKYKIPLYLQMIAEAEQKIQNEPAIVKERMRELKAYLHYMVLYFDWVADQRSNDAKAGKAGALCIYLAKINRLQLVNSYYLIATITSRYPTTGNFYRQYNNVNGLAYHNGNLPLITAAEIDNDFQIDNANFNNTINKYTFETAFFVKDRFGAGNIIPLKTITVQLKYTSGLDFYNRCEFFIHAPAAGSFTINYDPAFDMPDKGYINFTVESAEKALEIIEDISLDRNAKAGSLTISLPSSGMYKLTVSSRYKSAVQLKINTNKNIFYKKGAFFGKATELYQNNTGLPEYFYIPTGHNKVYFSMSNSNSANGFASAATINNAFAIKDNNGKTLTARFVTPNDSALFYIDIPGESQGKFCRITRKANYDLIFANISNFLWFAEPKPQPCTKADFTVSVINKKGNCITQLKAVSTTGQFQWEVNDMGNTYSFSGQQVIELPDYSSPNAVVTLTNGIDCSVTKRVADDQHFNKAKQDCASGAPLPGAGIDPAIYPNPSTGIFYCSQNGAVLNADEIIISNIQGDRLGNFKNVQQFNISHVPAGLYWYKMIIKGEEFKGKLLKL